MGGPAKEAPRSQGCRERVWGEAAERKREECETRPPSVCTAGIILSVTGDTPRFTAGTTGCGHSQPHAPRQPLEATATHGRSTHEGTCYPTVQAARRLRLRGIKGLVHSTAFLKAFKAGRVLGDHVSQGFPSPHALQFQLGGNVRTQPEL